MERICFLLGISPLFFFCFFLMIKKKNFLFSIPTLLLAIAMVCGIWQLPQEKKGTQELTADSYTYLFNTTMLEENYEQAKVYLNQMYQTYGDIPEVLIGQLRLAVLQGNTKQAVFVAKEMCQVLNCSGLDLSEEEHRFVNDVAEQTYVSLEAYKRDQAIYYSLAEAGYQPSELGYQEITDKEIEAAQKKVIRLQKDICNKIEENTEAFENGKKTVEIAEAIRLTEKLGEILDMVRLGETGLEDSSTEKKLSRYVNELAALFQTNRDVLLLPQLKQSFPNACAITENYEALVQYADQSGEAGALACVAYLYLIKEIRRADFSEVSWNLNFDEAVEKCKTIYRELSRENRSKEELKEYKEYLDIIVERSKNEIIAGIEERITNSIDENKGSAENYFQGAVLNSELSDYRRVYQYIDKAVEEKDTCQNQQLSEILSKIGAITDMSADDNEIKNFNLYLEEGYKESLVLDYNEITVPESFLNTGNLYVNEKRTRMNIGLIKTEDFPKIRAYVSSSSLALSKLEDLSITDCNVRIKDFTVEKVTYDNARIMLVCDNSGSMAGSVQALQDAVAKYIDAKSPGESIGIVTFDHSILQNITFTDNIQELLDAVSRFEARGGTDIGLGINTAMEHYGEEEKSFHVIILMTDGNDNSYDEASLEKLRRTCLKNNVIVYTLGLGNVNAEYLKKIADYGMGSFVYSQYSTQLEELYSFLHNQLDQNYLITYQPADKTTQYDRELSISSETEEFCVTRTYDLVYEKPENKNPSESGDATEPGSAIDPGSLINPDKPNENIKEESEKADSKQEKTKGLCYVDRLGISTIVVSGAGNNLTQKFTILGEGLQRAEDISISLIGNKKYTGLTYQIEDGKTIRVTLPGGVECSKYEIVVVMDGRSYSLKYLDIIKDSEKIELKFGNYCFKANNIYEGNGVYQLSGNVVMNDYLHFKGDVILRGSLDGEMLSLSESQGSYVIGAGKLPGILADFFDNRISFPKLNEICLYSTDRYDKNDLTGFCYYGPMSFQRPYVEIHPEYLKVTLQDLSIDYPILNNLLEYKNSPFYASQLNQSIVVAKDKIGFIMNVKSDTNLSKYCNLGKAKLSLGSFEIGINTFFHNYKFNIKIKLNELPIMNDSAWGFEIGIKSGKFDHIQLIADAEIDALTVPVYGVPLTVATISNARIGIGDLAAQTQNADFAKRLLYAKFYAQIDVNFLKVNQLVPGIDKWEFISKLLDFSIVKLEDTTGSVSPGNMVFEFNTTAKLFEMAEIGRLEMIMGKQSYQNYILGIYEEVVGYHLKTMQEYGLNFNKNAHISVNGETNLDINNKAAGIMINGGMQYKFKLFHTHSNDIVGNGFIGVHNNYRQFTILLKGTDRQNNKETGIRLDFSAEDGFDSVLY